MFNYLKKSYKLNKINSSLIKIDNIRLLDKRQNPKYVFFTGDYLKLILEMQFKNQVSNFDLHIFLYRKDGILCYQNGIKNILKQEVSLIIEKIYLLEGDYSFIIIAFDNLSKSQLAVKKVDFKVFSDKKDHGIIYLNHKWEI